MATDTLCLPLHEGLPDLADPSQWGKPPNVDGFVEPDIGVTTNELETGWTGSSRVTYVADAVAPQMVFQGLKDNAQPYIYLAFVVRFDTAFDPQDRIVLVLHPDFATAMAGRSADHRRIDILPFVNAAGVPIGSGVHITTTDSTSYDIQTNATPFDVKYYKYDVAANAWVATSAPIANTQVRVRQWQPHIASPTPANDHNWSIEIKLPVSRFNPDMTVLGGAEWVDLNQTAGGFALYFNVIRACSNLPTSPCTQIVGGGTCSQYAWPRANYGAEPFQGLLLDPVGLPPAITDHLSYGNAAPMGKTALPREVSWPTWLGKCVIGAAIGTCKGVRFISGPNSIGVKTAAAPIPPYETTVHTGVGKLNRFAATIVNDGSPADKITAEFRIAKWGVPGTTPTAWPKIASTPNPTSPHAALATGATDEFTLDWTGTGSEPTGDRCLWVLLDSTANVDFSESSVRRNLTFTPLSVSETEATLGGEYESAPPGGKHRILLLVTRRLIESQSYARLKPDQAWLDTPARAYDRQVEREGPDRVFSVDVERTLSPLEKRMLNRYRAMPGQAASTWLVIHNAYRELPLSLTLDNSKCTVYEPAGAFAYVAEHVGAVNEYKYTLAGAQVLSQDGAAYRVEVPNHGHAVVKIRLETVDRPPQSVGCLALLLAPIFAFWKALKSLLGSP